MSHLRPERFKSYKILVHKWLNKKQDIVIIFLFKDPVPMEPWQGTRDATKKPPMCAQVAAFLDDGTLKGEEDCLYLNVFTTKVKQPVFALYSNIGTFYTFCRNQIYSYARVRISEYC